MVGFLEATLVERAVSGPLLLLASGASSDVVVGVGPEGAGYGAARAVCGPALREAAFGMLVVMYMLPNFNTVSIDSMTEYLE